MALPGAPGTTWPAAAATSSASKTRGAPARAAAPTTPQTSSSRSARSTASTPVSRRMRRGTATSSPAPSVNVSDLELMHRDQLQGCVPPVLLSSRAHPWSWYRAAGTIAAAGNTTHRSLAQPLPWQSLLHAFLQTKGRATLRAVPQPARPAGSRSTPGSFTADIKDTTATTTGSASTKTLPPASTPPM